VEDHIFVYTKASCLFCSSIIRWLNKENITFVEKNINDEEVYKEFSKFNVEGVPLLTIIKEGSLKKKILGFNQKELEKYFKKIEGV